MAEDYAALLQRISSGNAPVVEKAQWQYDPAYENTRNQIQQGLAGLQSSTELSTRRLNEDYQTSANQMATNQTDTLRQLQEKLGSQGIGYSGINVREQGRLGEKYQQNVGQLVQTKTRGLEDILRSQTAQQAEYQNRMSQAEIDRADRERSYEMEQASVQAQAQAAQETANKQRQWLEDIQRTLLESTQPVTNPTGQVELPPPPSIPQLLQQAPPPAAKTPQQQIGETGVDPRQIQQLLKTRGFDPGPVDGVVGIKTQRALAAWKQSVGMPANADFDANTYQVLISSGVGSPGIAAPSSIGASRSSGPARKAF